MLGLKNKKQKRITRTAPTGAGSQSRVVAGRRNAPRSRSSANPVLRKVLLWILALAFLGTVFYALFFSSFLSIKEIDISGNGSVKTDAILSEARSLLSGKKLGLFKRDNFIILDGGGIKNDLLEKFKQIDSVAIDRKFPDKLEIRITERKTALILCSGDPCFVIDAGGSAFAPADFGADQFGENDLSVLRDLSQKPIDAGVSLDPDLLRFVADIKNRLKQDLGIGIKQEIDTPALVSGDIRVETDEGWKIFFNQNIGTDKEIEMLKTVLSNNIKDARSGLDYVDLRVDNKVYYKMKNSDPASPPAGSDGSGNNSGSNKS